MNPHILLCGLPSDSPIAFVARACEAAGVPYFLLNQRTFPQTQIEFTLNSQGFSGILRRHGEEIALETLRGVYLRLMDTNRLPEIIHEPPASPQRIQAVEVCQGITEWSEVTTARVLNRLSAMGSNTSKPYQSGLIRQLGFTVPESIVTNDPDEVREFQALHPKLIYKSVSGVRSIVRPLDEASYARLEAIRRCPTQFQAWVSGTDLRVHVVGNAVFATKIETTGTDYRYAHLDKEGETRLTAIEIDDELAERCVDLAHALDLPLAGIDLRRTPEGEYVCFEVNPSPGFTYYESHTEQPIAAAVVSYLAGES